MTTIIAATNRLNSYSMKLAIYYQKRLKEKGLEASILSLTELPANIISSDMYGKRSAEFQPVQDRVSATDKFIFIVPEYNGSFPGILKVFIDACKFPDSFFDKKAALVGLSTGKYGNVRGIDHLVGICHYINLHVLSLRLHINAIDKELDENGNIIREETLKYTDQQMDRFIEF